MALKKFQAINLALAAFCLVSAVAVSCTGNLSVGAPLFLLCALSAVIGLATRLRSPLPLVFPVFLTSLLILGAKEGVLIALSGAVVMLFSAFLHGRYLRATLRAAVSVPASIITAITYEMMQGAAEPFHIESGSFFALSISGCYLVASCLCAALIRLCAGIPGKITGVNAIRLFKAHVAAVLYGFFTAMVCAEAYSAGGTVSLFISAMPLSSLLVWDRAIKRREATLALRHREHLFQEKRRLRDERHLCLLSLTAGLAHEINNPLQGVAGITEVLLASGIDDNIRLPLIEILSHCRRAGDVLTELSSGISSGRAGECRHVALGPLVVEGLEEAKKDRSGIIFECEKDLSPVPMVPVNSIQMKYAFRNIFLSAIDAVGREGRIRVKIRKVKGEIVISVRDNGPGIPEEKLPFIFDPFSAPVRPEAPSGAGLSVAYCILRCHGGRIDVSNNPEGGSKVQVYIPMTDKRQISWPLTCPGQT